MHHLTSIALRVVAVFGVDQRSEEIKVIRHSPTAAKGEYRVIVLWKNITQERGEEALADDVRYFAYITNDWDTPATDLVCHANKRCNQEKLIETLMD